MAITSTQRDIAEAIYHELEVSGFDPVLTYHLNRLTNSIGEVLANHHNTFTVSDHSNFIHLCKEGFDIQDLVERHTN